MDGRDPIEVAIVGGGCAGITTAFELTRPEHRGRYRVTVYQQGWRLGGKGASGRGPADRIEEHGFHVWMGFYENAFQLLRECYAELGRDPARCRIADWKDAFVPDPLVGVVDRASGGWRNWMAYFPPGPGQPGEPLPGGGLYSPRGYLGRLVKLLGTLLESARSGEPAPARDGRTPPPPSLDQVSDRVRQLLKLGTVATTAGAIEAIGLLEILIGGLSRVPQSLPLRLLEAIAAGARRQLEVLSQDDEEMRRLWEVIELVLATLRGAIRFGLAMDPRGLDAIDDYDWREWLRLNGASEAALDSAVLRGIYALMFGYEGGDVERPRMAAGQALRGALRMFFSYRGAFFWKMKAGMGDVIFAPYYEVLKRRGVRFRFFHRLENVKLADPASLAPGERPFVSALEFDVQAEVAGGDDCEYQPLVDVDGLPCWPAQPDWGQLVHGDRLRGAKAEFESYWDRRRVRANTLRVGEDFDAVVLAIGLGAVPHVCKELVKRDRRWRAMVENVQTVATQAFQLWLREDLKHLGWRDPSVSISAYVQPFETWADMAQLLSEERWPAPPGAIAYFCGVLPEESDAAPSRVDAGYPGRRSQEVRARAVEFLERDVGHFWPKAVHADGFRWELLMDPDETGPGPAEADASRFASQFWTANVNPSDRYVLSLPGTQRYRISPLDNSYDNLTLAGDWTECGHNAGCVEAAVISGRLAAHAIARTPRLEDIVGYDHP